MQVAVIGAGLAGTVAARSLADAGHEVVIWEKSRGVGGRTSSRRAGDGARFDHGAPFLHDGAAPLSGLPASAPHTVTLPDGTTSSQTVGIGAANAPAKDLASGLDVRSSTRIVGITADGDRWALAAEHGAALGSFDAVIVTAPAPQAAELLQTAAPVLADRAASVAFDPCWAVMASWDTPLGLPFSAVRDQGGARWAVADAPKPGRAPGERWVLHATAAWSGANLELDADEAAGLLLEEFSASLSAALPAPAHLAAHRWRYAQPRAPLSDLFLHQGTLLAAGDWCGGTTAGDAVRSGRGEEGGRWGNGGEGVRGERRERVE
ncbi:MAG: NAD(P)/FAD-dependent oxidoreductase, partial [Myxococcales bacterium]